MHLNRSSLTHAALALSCAAAMAWSAPAAAEPTLFLDYSITSGAVWPTDLTCVDPFAGCELTVGGSGTAIVSGDASRSFTINTGAFLRLSEDASLPPGQWRAGGSFDYFEAFSALDSIRGEYSGIFDASTFTAELTFTVTEGRGLFAGRSGTGTSTIAIIPGSGPGGDEFHYTETGRFAFEPAATGAVPLPTTAALAGVGLLMTVASARPGQRRRAQNPMSS